MTQRITAKERDDWHRAFESKSVEKLSAVCGALVQRLWVACKAAQKECKRLGAQVSDLQRELIEAREESSAKFRALQIQQIQHPGLATRFLILEAEYVKLRDHSDRGWAERDDALARVEELEKERERIGDYPEMWESVARRRLEIMCGLRDTATGLQHQLNDEVAKNADYLKVGQMQLDRASANVDALRAEVGHLHAEVHALTRAYDAKTQLLDEARARVKALENELQNVRYWDNDKALEAAPPTEQADDDAHDTSFF